MSQFTLGYLPTRRNFFSQEAARKEKTAILTAIRALSPEISIVDLSFLNEEGLLFSEADVARTIREFEDKKVDAIFAPHCNFGCESAVAMVARAVGKPILIWAPRDDAPEPDGTRLRDSQCGVFATSKVLQRHCVPFSWIPSCRCEEPIFREKFTEFLRAANVVKHFRNARIGQIGTRPRDFNSVICNEGELLERFGIQTIPLDSSALFRECRAIRSAGGERLEAAAASFRQYQPACGSEQPETALNLAALKLAMMNFVERENLEAVALQCWDSMQCELNVCPCAVNGLLADEGIAVACETDVHGAISSTILKNASLSSVPIFFADLTIRHPQNDNAELLWHCGPFPPSLARGAVKIDNHFVLPSHANGVLSMELKPGHVSVVRFDGGNGKYALFSGEGAIIDGPFNQGTYGYLEVSDWPLWEEKFVRGPYIHHVAGAYLKANAILKEATTYLPGVDFDPAPGTQF
ncbi:MAG: hypothetical protein PHS41_08760 [Victivallaceae bacterium]|nr:hypothetical protein [Victivallaceae bacterium]